MGTVTFFILFTRIQVFMLVKLQLFITTNWILELQVRILLCVKCCGKRAWYSQEFYVYHNSYLKYPLKNINYFVHSSMYPILSTLCKLWEYIPSIDFVYFLNSLSFIAISFQVLIITNMCCLCCYIISIHSVSASVSIVKYDYHWE